MNLVKRCCTLLVLLLYYFVKTDNCMLHWFRCKLSLSKQWNFAWSHKMNIWPTEYTMYKNVTTQEGNRTLLHTAYRCSYRSPTLSWFLLALPCWPWTVTAHRPPSWCWRGAPSSSKSKGQGTTSAWATGACLEKNSQMHNGPHQSELGERRMLPQRVIQDILQQWIGLPSNVTLGDAHSGRFPSPWG